MITGQFCLVKQKVMMERWSQSDMIGQPLKDKPSHVSVGFKVSVRQPSYITVKCTDRGLLNRVSGIAQSLKL